MNRVIKQMAKDDINFNLGGSATYTQAKNILKICRIVYLRASGRGEKNEM